MDSMTARDARWCRHYGRKGKAADQERRSIKRGKRNDWKKKVRKGDY